MQEIRYLPISQLKTHPDNPRVIKDKQFEILCRSLKENKSYFETRPILCNKQMVIFAGNMRYRAAKEIGLTEVPVSIMDVSEEKQKELMLRDNHQNGSWDWGLLAANFDDSMLASVGFDVPGTSEDEPVSGSACVRCEELKKAVEGHQRRSGHVSPPLSAVGINNDSPATNEEGFGGGGE